MATGAATHDDHAHDDHAHAHPTGWRRFVYSTNHKDIGTMYLVFAVIAGVIGAAMSIAIRVGADVSRRPALPRNPYLQRVRDLARPDHDLLHGDAGDDRRLRQLVRAADDRRARHGVPAHEQHLVLAAAGLLRAAPDVLLRRGRAGRQRRRRGLDHLSRRCRPRAIRDRRSISRSCRSIWPAPRRSSAPSTSSPRSSTCARRA